MGFFSWDCIECGHPMLSFHAYNKINKWMNDVIVHESTGSVLVGKYDGYGRVDDRQINWEKSEPCCRHYDCWVAAGKPGYTKASEQSRDQGYFFGNKDHNMKRPKVKKNGK